MLIKVSKSSANIEENEEITVGQLKREDQDNAKVKSIILSIKDFFFDKVLSSPVIEKLFLEILNIDGKMSKEAYQKMIKDFYQDYEKIVNPSMMPHGISGLTMFGNIYLQTILINTTAICPLDEAIYLLILLHETIHLFLRIINKDVPIYQAISPSLQKYQQKIENKKTITNFNEFEAEKLVELLLFGEVNIILYLSQAKFIMDSNTWKLSREKIKENFKNCQTFGIAHHEPSKKYREHDDEICYGNNTVVCYGRCYFDNNREYRQKP